MRFSQSLHDWETLAVAHLLHYNPSPDTNSSTNGRRFLQPVSEAFLDTLIAHDAHDVVRNDPPRPPVSSKSDRGRRWYDAICARRGGGTRGVLREAEPVYFSLRPEGGAGGADGGEEIPLSRRAVVGAC